MPNKESEPPVPEGSPPARESNRVPARLKPDQYEIKVRWDKASRVLDVTSLGVKFDFNSPLKVGVRYPITVTAPGVSIASTLEITRCQLTVDPEAGRFFRVEGRFYPYLE